MNLLTAAKRLEGKVAVITGGSRGIGEKTARLFAQHGAKVVVADLQDDLGRSVCDELGSSSATYVHCDVTKEADVENAINTAVSKHGKLDIMFNNAGVSGAPIANLIDNPPSEFDKVFDVNVKGVFLGTKHAAKVMIPNRSGSIIQTASICGTVVGVAGHAYTSSKYAVVGLMKSAAVELGRHGIRVNSVSPYVVATPMAMDYYKLEEKGIHSIYSNLKGTKLERDDVANAALFLASDESKYISGHDLKIDGGFTITNVGFNMFDLFGTSTGMIE